MISLLLTVSDRRLSNPSDADSHQSIAENLFCIHGLVIPPDADGYQYIADRFGSTVK